ncbi:MAG: TIGR04053 family radical SAM/SPASM domain-containing protein [Actinomycetia bacterium]|nr:TIGR04053 family radical SAM/SPASM domain-containing protein [Actinomycetes bacterium]
MAPRPVVRHQHSDAGERPFIVIWESTQACPLACVHCRASAQHHRDPGELTTAEAVELMGQVASFGAPPPLFIITGGDPFQRPDLVELVRAGTAAGLPVAVSPSGTPTLTADALAGLHEAGARAISLSLDGSTAQVHDSFRRVEGVFDLTLAGWRAAREIGLRVQINTTVTRHNLLDLPNIAALVQRMGALTWSGFFLVPTGRGAELGSLSPDEVEDILNWLYDMGTALPTKTTETHHFRRVVLQRQILAARGEDPVAVLGLGELYQTLRRRADELGLLSGQERRRRAPMDVNAGRGFVFISHRGAVHPSGFLPTPAGNVRETPLPQIYRESELFTALRDPRRLGGRCGACEFAGVCGGSRSRAYAVTGDPFAEEPWCDYAPGSFPYQDDLAALLR